MRTILLLLFLSIISVAASPATKVSTLKVNTKRLVTIEGTVNHSVMEKAQEVLNLSLKSKDPIYINISSPGGDVYSGLQFIQALGSAKKRGNKIICTVPIQAMSISFAFLSTCDERYALPNALLLWHPMRTALRGKFTVRQLKNLAEEKDNLENSYDKIIKKALGLTDPEYEKHYTAETTHVASDLKKLAPGFLTIVDNIEGIPHIYFKGKKDGRNKAR